MPTIRSSEEGRRLAEARWRKHREREAEIARLAEAWGSDALPLAILTKSEQERMIGAVLRQGAEGALVEAAPSIVVAAAEREGVSPSTVLRTSKTNNSFLTVSSSPVAERDAKLRAVAAHLPCVCA